VDFLPLAKDENPLTDRQYTDMNAALADLNRARRKIDRAKAAGIACDEHSGMCDYVEDAIKKLKSVYFPNKP